MPDASFMSMALELAGNGRGLVHPNPLVGAVLVHDGQVIGTGYHTRFGAPHAEVEAISDAKISGHDPRGSTLYVTLEPCCHHGKTPPCTDAIIAAGIARVVFAMEDPHDVVAGKGAARLRAAGIEIASGVMEAEARRLNEAFIRFHSTGLPFVTWKFAQTLDGSLTLVPGRRTRISCDESDRRVDVMRTEADAVLVGVETVLIDDPSLRVRSAAGRDPWRIVFDSRLRIPESSSLVRNNGDSRTLVVAGQDAPERNLGAEILRVPLKNGRIDPGAALSALARRGLLAILLESGRTLAGSLIAEKLVQRLVAFTAPRWNSGNRILEGTFARIEDSGDDSLLVLNLAPDVPTGARS